MSASLIATILGLLCIILTKEIHCKDVFRDFKCRTRDCDRVVGGSKATVNKHPWIAALFVKDSYQCAGSIIADEFILTAAHCVKGIRAEEMTATLGDHIPVNGSETNSPIFQIQEIIVHSCYYFLNDTRELDLPEVGVSDGDFLTVLNDIALLKVKGKIEFSENVNPICISKSNDHKHAIATVTGWRKNNFHPDRAPSNVLKEAQVLVFDNPECKKSWPLNGLAVVLIRPCGLNAEFIDEITHFGDDGGPLIVENSNNKWEQIGITIYYSETSTYYIKVYHYLKWIESVTGQSAHINC